MDLPKNWRSYFPSRTSKDLMASGRTLEPYNAQLLMRRKNPHDLKDTIKDYQGWPLEIPEEMNAVFTSEDQIVEPASIDFFQTVKEKDKEKTLTPEPVYTTRSSIIEPRKMFKAKEGIIDREGGTLLARIIDKNGKEFFRWMDIRMFNMALWNKKNTLHMQVVSNDNPIEFPKDFNEDIQYA